MKTQDKDMFHGIALTQIVEHNSFKALNSADNKYGHYLVNTDRKILIKHSSKPKSPWQFTFQAQDLSTLKGDIEMGHKTYIGLVCGRQSVCANNEEQIETLIDIDSTQTQWIRVELPAGGSMRVKGSKGDLKRTVPHNSFPNKLFE